MEREACFYIESKDSTGPLIWMHYTETADALPFLKDTVNSFAFASGLNKNHRIRILEQVREQVSSFLTGALLGFLPKRRGQVRVGQGES